MPIQNIDLLKEIIKVLCVFRNNQYETIRIAVIKLKWNYCQDWKVETGTFTAITITAASNAATDNNINIQTSADNVTAAKVTAAIMQVMLLKCKPSPVCTHKLSLLLTYILINCVFMFPEIKLNNTKK